MCPGANGRAGHVLPPLAQGCLCPFRNHSRSQGPIPRSRRMGRMRSPESPPCGFVVFWFGGDEAPVMTNECLVLRQADRPGFDCRHALGGFGSLSREFTHRPHRRGVGCWNGAGFHHPSDRGPSPSCGVVLCTLHSTGTCNVYEVLCTNIMQGQPRGQLLKTPSWGQITKPSSAFQPSLCVSKRLPNKEPVLRTNRGIRGMLCVRMGFRVSTPHVPAFRSQDMGCVAPRPSLRPPLARSRVFSR